MTFCTMKDQHFSRSEFMCATKAELQSYVFVQHAKIPQTKYTNYRVKQEARTSLQPHNF